MSINQSDIDRNNTNWTMIIVVILLLVGLVVGVIAYNNQPQAVPIVNVAPAQQAAPAATNITLPPPVAGQPGVAGPAGAQGATGAQGADGATGQTGQTGQTGADGADGANGQSGAAGAAGAPGAPAAQQQPTPSQ